MNAITQPIRFGSFLGENALQFHRQVVAYLAEATGLPTEVVVEAPSEPDSLLDADRIDAAFLCGLIYVRRSEAARANGASRWWLVAAPVRPAERYRDRPAYYSDVIVRAGSGFQTFEDLRGATFAYNQVTSFSGYVLPLYHLRQFGGPGRFFAQMVPSGSHAASMNWVEEGRADAAAIDSVVLEMELSKHPDRAGSFRVVGSLGPYGMPPLIASPRLPARVRQSLRRALLDMHRRRRGAAILRQGGVKRFAAVADRTYADMRRLLRTLRRSGAPEVL